VTATSRFKPPLVLGIAGGSGSGKSTIARSILEALPVGQGILLQQDHYYRSQSHLPLSEREMVNYDHPDALELDLLTSHLDALRTGEPTPAAQMEDPPPKEKKSSASCRPPRPSTAFSPNAPLARPTRGRLTARPPFSTVNISKSRRLYCVVDCLVHWERWSWCALRAASPPPRRLRLARR